MSLGDRIGFVEKLSRVAPTLSGRGCNDLMLEADIGCPCAKVWLGTGGDDE